MHFLNGSTTMLTPINSFKQALKDKRPQIGLWMGLASDYSAEICALAGFDWLVIDGEHSPNNLSSILAQLKTLAAYPGSHAVCRVPVGETALIKQYLDLGAQNILVPMVDTAEQAAQLVHVDGNYDYLIKMPMVSVSAENVDRLRKECAETAQALETLRNTTVEQMWLSELDTFQTHYQTYVSKRAAEYSTAAAWEKYGKEGAKKKKGGKA
jgi:hypothetical protein